VKAADFDAWYAAMAQSAEHDQIVERALGLPPELQSTSLLSWDGIAEVAGALRLSPGERLLDLACGRGGYGLELARRTGARLIGIDFSAVALEQARRRAAELAQDAEFRLGELEATGLEPASVDAAICVDAIQFADQAVALREVRRVLVPGGRVVLTCWQGDDDRVPERIRRIDLARDLRATGFTDVTVTERPDWRAAERVLWETALATDAGDDPALHSMQDEARRVLDTFDVMRRVLATASAPS
jgi:SAM-dependent methyltransferase